MQPTEPLPIAKSHSIYTWLLISAVTPFIGAVAVVVLGALLWTIGGVWAALAIYFIGPPLIVILAATINGAALAQRGFANPYFIGVTGTVLAGILLFGLLFFLPQVFNTRSLFHPGVILPAIIVYFGMQAVAYYLAKIQPDQRRSIVTIVCGAVAVSLAIGLFALREVPAITGPVYDSDTIQEDAFQERDRQEEQATINAQKHVTFQVFAPPEDMPGVDFSHPKINLSADNAIYVQQTIVYQPLNLKVLVQQYGTHPDATKKYENEPCSAQVVCDRFTTPQGNEVTLVTKHGVLNRVYVYKDDTVIEMESIGAPVAGDQAAWRAPITLLVDQLVPYPKEYLTRGDIDLWRGLEL